MTTAIGIIVAILCFGFLILTHELGHFLLARIFDVKVNEFSIGMGPRLFGIHGKETDYNLRLFPIGGYCAMEGESEDSDDSRSFNAKEPWKRALIILAGATVNLLTGFLVMVILVSTFSKIGTTTISSFAENAASESQGLQAGDKVIGVNGNKILTSMDLAYFMAKDPDGVIDFVVERDGKTVSIDRVKFAMSEDEDGNKSLQYDFTVQGVKPSVTTVPKYAFLNSLSIFRMVWDSLFDLARGKYQLSDLSGPVGTVSVIAQTTTSAVKSTDYSSLLYLLALLAINLGVFNLLPFPGLDGGRFWLIAFEAVTGKKPPKTLEAALNFIGIVALLGLMLVVTASDIKKFF